jgi:hypothetical protein
MLVLQVGKQKHVMWYSSKVIKGKKVPHVNYLILWCFVMGIA